jgi:hypothetical protein
MSRNINIGSTRKLYRLINIGLAALALMLMVSPGFAAGPQPPSSQPQSPNATCPPDGQCFADVSSANPFYTFVNRIYQQDLVSGYACGGVGEPCDSQNRPYYRPVADVNRGQMSKFIDNARRLPQIHMDVRTGSAPIYSRNDTGTAIAAYSTSGQALLALSESQVAIYAQTGASTAVYGTATGTGSIGVQGIGSTGVKGTGTSGTGVWGVSTNNAGVQGNSTNNAGVQGNSTGGTGVWGVSTNNAGVQGNSTGGIGVYGISTGFIGIYGQSTSETGVQGVSTDGDGIDGVSTNFYGVAGQSYNNVGVIGFSDASDAVVGISTYGRAGHFEGSVQVDGILSKGGGSFKIDHPLDPANQYLYHSFVESPDMMNVYNGNVILDGKGEAWVQMPDWFDALNRDFRYQLTTIGGFAPVYVAEKVKANRFKIGGGSPGMEVSWQVTGIRQDPFANAHRIPVEQDKSANEKGKYLHPTEWGQSASSGIDYERQQQMQQSVEAKP